MTDSKIIVAFDFDDLTTALTLAEQLNPNMARLKIGKAMFTRFGPAVVRALHERGFEVFLDLKYHDIPNTVADAIRAAADLGIWMVNVHAAGGSKMMEAASSALQHYDHPPLLIAVTVLTSMNETMLASIGINRPLATQVEYLTQLAYHSGLNGVVCSAQEAAAVKRVTTSKFLTVTPGIRPSGSQADDQSRIVTPRQAIENGSDYLVIGRPITQATDPLAMLTTIYQELQEQK